MKAKSGNGGTKRRVLIVDDHPIMRDGLIQLLGRETDLEVCAEAASAEEALEKILRVHPDLAVVDVSLHGKSGLELLKDLQAMELKLPVLILSMHDETVYAERMLKSGARGYVSKKAGGEAVLHAVREVLNGKIHLSTRMRDTIIHQAVGDGSSTPVGPIQTLTDREFEIFEMIGDGLATAEIARRLHVSLKTVEAHRQRLKEKLKLPSSTTLVQHAIRWKETQVSP